MKKAFVAGHPIAHSRSPLIHGFWIREYGVDGSYERLDVPPSDFPAFLASLADRGFVGGNVTVPHKEAAYLKVSRRTERADRLKAVNTVWLENGELWGDNTDVIGFMANLEQSLGAEWDRSVESALVIGAGGAARAVVAGLLERVGRVVVVNRTLSKAEELALDFGRAGGTVEALPWAARDRAVASCRLIVNTTTQGMHGQPPLDMDLTQAAHGTVVTDIVYVPLKTPLLSAAEARGLRTVDGLGMLLHQAVPGFTRWFGIAPKVTPALRALIAADIEAAR